VLSAEQLRHPLVAGLLGDRDDLGSHDVANLASAGPVQGREFCLGCGQTIVRVVADGFGYSLHRPADVSRGRVSVQGAVVGDAQIPDRRAQMSILPGHTRHPRPIFARPTARTRDSV
jgi:hypothetical protein